MEDHIRLFDTVEEFNSAYTGDEYVEPWVSYCMENSGVSFNKKENPLESLLTFNIMSAGVISWKESINWEEAQEIDEYFKSIEYNKNGIGWITITANTDINVVAGDVVQFRGDNDAYYYYDENEYVDYMTNFMGSTAGFTVEGNIMSLIDSTDFATATTLTNKNTFSILFNDCTGLTSAENLILPATTLTDYCYQSMFEGCLSLTTTPELPATTLAEYCYNSMFNGCTNLTTAPELPATALTSSCYSWMFAGCTSLTTAPELPATTLASNCYNTMFYGCTSLTTAPELPATTLAEGCYWGMFSDCTSLTTAPVLSATVLGPACYKQMFQGCTSLTTAPELPATTLANYCYKNMFQGCTSLTTAPELPATTSADNCYAYMFNGCSSLNYIKCLATSKSTSFYTYNWVQNVASTGTFVKNASMSSWTTGNNGIPSNWTVQDAS